MAEKQKKPSAVAFLLRDRKARPILIRYLLPVAILLLLVLLSSLPMISFRTGAGDSEARSLFYWHTASFFGAEGDNGAYDYLVTDTGVDNATTAWARAVVITVLISAVCAVLGALLTLLSSFTAIYLMLAEGKAARARQIGRIFRVVIGNRVMLCIPYLLSVLPFVFPRLLAYDYTSLMFYDATASFTPFDPLWIALILLIAELLYAFWTKDMERRSKWDLFRPIERRVGMSERSLAEIDKEWAEAVKADLAGEEKAPTVLGVEQRSSHAETETIREESRETKDASKQDEDDSEEARAMRESLQSLFSDEDEPKTENRKKRK